MDVHIFTEEEIHEIAYLTLHGWTRNRYAWTKPGQTWINQDIYDLPTVDAEFNRQDALDRQHELDAKHQEAMKRLEHPDKMPVYDTLTSMNELKRDE